MPLEEVNICVGAGFIWYDTFFNSIEKRNKCQKIYPISHAIRLVNRIIKIAFPAPANEKNMIP